MIAEFLDFFLPIGSMSPKRAQSSAGDGPTRPRDVQGTVPKEVPSPESLSRGLGWSHKFETRAGQVFKTFGYQISSVVVSFFVKIQFF